MRPRSPRSTAETMLKFARDLPTRLAIDLRARLLLEEYRARRRYYASRAVSDNLMYDDSAVIARTRARLDERSVRVGVRSMGTVQTLAFLPDIGWHRQLLPHLQRLGPLFHFDYVARGVQWQRLLSSDEEAIDATRRAISEAFVQFAASLVGEATVDWVFVYGSGLEVLATALGRVRELTRAPIVGLCLDDKQSWILNGTGEQSGGQVSIAPELDLAWTSARIACEWYLVEDGNPIYLPEGCSPDLYRPGTGAPDLDACFVGQAYGFRRAFLADLARFGVDVAAYGSGWPGGPIGDSELVRVFQRSKIILGLGGIGWAEQLKNVKGRDFDGPCIGTGCYMTSYHPELTNFFDVGREIVCFSSADEAAELAGWLLHDEPRRRRIAAAGRARCLAEHTWDHRFGTILKTLGVFAG